MAIVIKPITVEVSKPNVFQAIAAKQNDCNSRFLKVTFVNEGEKINVIPSAKVTISAERNDGKSDSFFGEVNDDGTATLPIHSWMLELPGYVECDISIIEEDSKLTCTTFSLLVEEAAHNSGDISEDEQYDVLTQLINDTNGIENRVIAYTDATYTPITRTNALEKRVTNLEQGIVPSPFVTDDTVAYTKDVPENALPYAEVSKIGGMTRKCTNLIPYPYYATTTQTVNGVTFTTNGDGSVTVNGTATANIEYPLSACAIKANVHYFLSGCPSGGSISTYYLDPRGFNSDIGSGLHICHTKDFNITFFIVIKSGATVSNLVFKPMFNLGETALPYEPYFEGLRSAPVTEVESVGKNFLDLEALANTSNWLIGGYQYCSFPLYLKPNTKYTFSRKDDSVATGVYALFSRTPNSNQAGTGGAWFVYPNSTDFTKKVVTITTDDNGMMYMNLYYTPTAISALVALIGDAQLELGDTATPYKPYVRNTLPIPEAVRPKNGINENVYDYIEWCDDGTKESHQRVGAVDMGTLDWTFESGNSRFIAPVENLASIATRGDNVLSSKFITDTAATVGDNWKGFSNLSKVFVYTTEYFSAISFKADLSGVMLYYELAEPVITDISDILPEDNFIGVEGNGTITLKNEYAYDVPSEITYRIEEVAV